MPHVTAETFRRPDGSYAYRLHLNGVPVLTSGGFLLEADARRVGASFAADPKGLHDFLKR